MPKLRRSAQERRKYALAAAIARGKVDKGIRTDAQLAEKLGMSSQRLYYHRKRYYQMMKVGEFCRMARELGFTGRELCAAVGVPYSDPEEGGAQQ